MVYFSTQQSCTPAYKPVLECTTGSAPQAVHPQAVLHRQCTYFCIECPTCLCQRLLFLVGCLDAARSNVVLRHERQQPENNRAFPPPVRVTPNNIGIQPEMEQRAQSKVVTSESINENK